MHTYSMGSPRCPGVRHAGNFFRFVCEERHNGLGREQFYERRTLNPTLEGSAAQVIDLCHAFFDAPPNSLSEREFAIAISPFLAATYDVDALASSRSQAVSLCVECNAFLAGLASDTSFLAQVTPTQHPSYLALHLF